jgi:hypothetical protein
MLSVVYPECCYARCRNAECRYAKCRGAIFKNLKSNMSGYTNILQINIDCIQNNNILHNFVVSNISLNSTR